MRYSDFYRGKKTETATTVPVAVAEQFASLYIPAALSFEARVNAAVDSEKISKDAVKAGYSELAATMMRRAEQALKHIQEESLSSWEKGSR